MLGRLLTTETIKYFDPAFRTVDKVLCYSVILSVLRRVSSRDRHTTQCYFSTLVDRKRAETPITSSSFYWASVANAPNVLQPYWHIVLPLDVPDLTASLLL